MALSSLLTPSSQGTNFADGQEVTGLLINLNGISFTGGALTSSAGTLINIDNNTGVATIDTTDTIDHWGSSLTVGPAKSNSSTVCLETVSDPTFGCAGTHKPIDLIIGSGPLGTAYANANSSITGRNPQIDGTGTFVITLSGVTATSSLADIVSGVSFEFGTSGNDFLTGTPGSPGTFSNNPVPEPSSLLLLGTGAIGIAGAIRRRIAVSRT